MVAYPPMMPRFHVLDSAPRPVAPYSHAVEVDGWVFVTGQRPNDPDDAAAPLPGGIEVQTRRTMENLSRVLAGVGLGLEHVLAARVFLTRFDEDYQPMNAPLTRGPRWTLRLRRYSVGRSSGPARC